MREIDLQTGFPVHHLTQPQGDVITVPPRDTASADWSSALLECFKDEETCWYGGWCCWLVDARTTASFDLDTSQNVWSSFWAVIVGAVVSLLVFGSLAGFVVGVGGGGYLLLKRIRNRTDIRRKRNIIGSDIEDCLVHVLCPLCAVCQEAREGKAAGVKVLDFCSGEEIKTVLEAHQRAIGLDDNSTSINESSSNASSAAEYGTFKAHLQTLSRTSKIIVSLWLLVAGLSILGQMGNPTAGQNIMVLFLVFLQPLAILYFLYWKTRRQYALLDIVVKLYAIGFWFTTFQSVIIEFILEMLIVACLYPFLGSSVGALTQDDGSNDDAADVANDAITGSGQQLSVGRSLARRAWRLFRLSSAAGAGANDYSASYGYGYAAAAAASDEAAVEAQRQNMRDNFGWILVGLFLMSFVVAAGVEETMKHFVVRCCVFPAPLRNPNAILVYLMAGALGFATSENIEYVFGTTSSPIPGTSVFVGELVILLVRVLMPVHVICSVLQAVNLSKVNNDEPMSLFRLLLPAVLLHGSFDFSLFVLSAVEFAYAVDDLSLEIASMVLALAISVSGALYAYHAFKKVESEHQGQYISVTSQQSESIVV